MERQNTQETITVQYNKLLESEPKLVTNFVPMDAAAQKRAFLSDEIRNPDHTYAKLDAIDFTERSQSIAQAGEEILADSALNPKHVAAYEQFVTGYLDKNRLMELAHAFKHETDPAEKERIRGEYMSLNIELYGEPDKATYRSLLREKVDAIRQKNLTGKAAKLRDELFELIETDNTDEKIKRFRPADETVEWMHDTVETLYSGMLSHVPEKDTFTEQEVQEIFQAIIHEEFGEAAEGWKVDVEPAKSINVKSTERRIVIPDDRGEISRETLRRLIVHEIGVHMLRSVMGGETDLEPLRNGLGDYYDSEEGLGTVMEQALEGEFVEAGVNYYITAGLSYYDGKDFRDVFEAKWRLSALLDDDITDESIAKAKTSAYSGTMRILRGTDELPWFKDLAYYNGSVDTWRYLESIRGDDTKFIFVLMGKANPANIAHERILYETSTI